MAKRRTRRDKIIASLRRQIRQGDKSDVATSSLLVDSPQKTQVPGQMPNLADEASLFNYDQALIRKDLTRTLIWAGMAFGLELGLYFLLR